MDFVKVVFPPCNGTASRRLLENLQVLLARDKIILVGKYSVFGEFFGLKHYKKLWPLLYERVELDLKMTNEFITSSARIHEIIL